MYLPFLYYWICHWMQPKLAHVHTRANLLKYLKMHMIFLLVCALVYRCRYKAVELGKQLTMVNHKAHSISI